MKKLYVLMLLLCAGMNVMFGQIAAPTLNSPADGYVYTNSVKPLLKMNTVSGASYYLFQWSEESDFNTYDSYVITSFATGLNVNRLKFGTTYYWRVFAITANYADTSASSEVWSFTTCTAPTLSSPSNGATLTTIKPTAYYNTITGAAGYQMQWSEDPDFATYEEYSLGSSNNGLTLNGLKFGTTYYWRVCAFNSNSSDTSAWSEVWHFTTCGAPPSLSSPSNGATLTTIKPTAYYSNSIGAAGYLMQWSEDPDFATYEEYSLGSSNNGLTLNGLKFGTTYYWRVCAFNSNSSDTSAWSEVWHFTTCGAPSLSSPSNGATLTTIKPTAYYSNSIGAAGYLMQWSEDPDFATYNDYSLGSSNNGLTLNGLKFGTTYYWRVCAFNSNSSDTSAWSEVWSFTTTNGAPTLSSPSNGAVLTAIKPTAYYNTISGAGGYLMQWSEDPNFATYEEYSLSSSNNGLTLNRLKFSTTYYWRVCAFNSNSSDTSAWSEVWSFTTTDGVPTLSSPSNGATLTAIKPTAYYNTVSGAGGYLMQWSEDPDFASYNDYSLGSSNNGLNINGLKFGTTYYWRVCAFNSNSSDTSAWSEVWNFTTVSAPTITAPNDGTILTNSISPNIRWTEIVGATRYIYQCDTSAAFNSSVRRTYTVSYMSGGSNPLNLRFGATYYLRMKATNTNESDTSAWSPVRTFTTSDAPVLNSPSNGNVYSSSVTPTLKCETIKNAGKYIFQWDTTSAFNSPLYGSTVQTSNSVSVGPLKLGTTYYWRVQATNNNDSDTSSWSTVWSFTTGGSIPTLASPSNGSTAVRLRPTLDWNSVSSCDYYDYECDTTPQFNSPELQSGAIAAGTSEVRLNQLRYGTTYYWRVRIRLNSDTSSWSTVWHFTTSGTIALTSPANGSNISRTIKPTLDWDYINDGDYYEYQYDLSPDFDSPELTSGLVAVGTSEIELTEPLRFGETYYWRVREYTSIDTTEWSATWSFNTPGLLALTSPANGSTLSRTIKPTLDWDYIRGGDFYEYQYDLSPDFDSPELTSGLVAVGTSEIELTEPLRFGETYYWRVREYTSIDTTEWSETWSFNTPAALALVSPANNATGRATTVTLDWDFINGGTMYEYQYDTCATFDSPSFISGTVALGTSQATVRYLRLGTTYYWRVREYSAIDTTAWSEVWNFTTGGGIPTLVSPANTATSIRLQPTLDWNAISSCDFYDYECDITPQFNSAELQSGTTAVGTSEVQLNQLRYGTTYYWRVRIRVGSDTSSWSAPWHFTTAETIALTSPADGSTLSRTIKPTLDWSPLNDGDYYEYQYDLSPNFDSPELVVGQRAVGTSEIELTEPLRFGETYYWRVREYTSIDTSEWSATWSFNTPGVLALTSPADGSTDIGSSVELDWDFINGGTVYHYQYDKTPNFTSANLVEGTVPLGTSHVTINNLDESSVYYWRVREFSTIDTSDWSAVWHFTTQMAPIYTDIYDTACVSYVWNNQTYTTSGNYQQHFVTALQADSTVTLHLTVYPAMTSTSTVNICESDLPYHYVNGDIDTVFEEGTPELSTFNYYFTTQHGCDSTVTLTLNVIPANFTEFSETACGSYTWNSSTYTESGDYEQTFTNANGCDSTVTLHLTIFTPSSSEFTETACGSYTWNSSTYTESGDYEQTFTNANGCDSTVTLHLTIFTPSTSEFTETACGSYTWNSSTYTESGDYEQTFTNANGCDSTVTLHLTVITINTEVDYVEIGGGYLEASQDNAEYQWIDCSNNEPVTGATQQQFTPEVSGNYACLITVGDCTDTTDCMDFAVGVDEWSDGSITLFPNPTTGKVNVQCTINDVQWGDVEIQVLDMYGRRIQIWEMRGETTQIDLSPYAPGVYLIRLVGNGKVISVQKVVRG